MASKRSGNRSPRAGSNRKKKTSGKLRKPTARQASLIKGVVEGKSVRKAALDAGYSPNTAEHAGELLSTEALRGFCQSRLSLDKILARIDEGMDAEVNESIVLGRKGQEKVQTSTYPNYSERRQAAALAAKLVGADPASKIEVKGDLTQLVKVTFLNVAACAEP
jgi:phage terminase small subunit